MDLVEHFRVIGRNWWRILLVSALVGGAVYAWSARKAKVYQASTLLSVSAGRADIGTSATKDETTFLATTYAQLATAKPVLNTAAHDSGLGISETTAESRVSASESGGVGFVTIDATGPSVQDATKLANATAKSLIAQVNHDEDLAVQQDLGNVNRQIQSLQAQLSALPADSPQRAALETQYTALLTASVTRQTQPRNRIDAVSSASGSTTPISPKPVPNALLAFLVALVVTAELTVALRAWGDRFSAAQDPEEIAKFVGLPLLAAIPAGDEREVVEAFRTLRTTIMVLPGTERPRSIAVVSENANAGKSFIAMNLARAAVGLDTQVILIDADLRRPSLHHDLRVPLRPGLTDVLNGRDVDAALHPVGGNADLRLLPSGSPSSDPGGILSGRAFRRLIEAFAGPRQLVVVDTPPARLFADALNVAAQCDATVFVIDVKTSRRRNVRGSVDSFQRAGANVIGTVVNRIASKRTDYYYEYTRS
jgi:succinoglycan biosynthesis transport protein ExoP